MAQQLDEYGNPTGESETDPYADKRASVGQWYQQYLGRQGGADEIQGWVTNQNFGGVEDAIKNSAEAKTRAQAQTTQQAPQYATQQPTNSAQAWNREGFRDQWMSTGTDVGRQNALLSQYGITPDASGRATLPSGEVIDLRIGAKSGQNLAGWTGVAGGGLKTGQAPGAGGGSNGSSSSVSTSSSGPAGAFDPRVQELYNMLLGRAQQGLAVDRNDPNIRAQSDAYGANAERARRNYLADTAEKSGPYANLQGEARVTAEKLGQNTGAFEAELVGREMTARRDEIAQALQSMQGLLTQEQQFALTKELAMLNKSIQEQQLGLEGQRIGLQGQQMSQQNDQFLRSLGLQEADRASYWDALRSGLIS